MAQKQFHRYQDDVKSFELGEALVGVISPGRLSGYQGISVVDNVDPNYVDITISHNRVGGPFAVKKSSNTQPPVLSDPLGVVVTKQGQIIHDTGEVLIQAIPKLLAGDEVRVDIIYMEHTYEESLSPTPITYGITLGPEVPVIEGTTNLNLPIWTTELEAKRVVLGYLVWNLASNANLGGMKLFYITIPSGDRIGDSLTYSHMFASSIGQYIYDAAMQGSKLTTNIIGRHMHNDNPPIIEKHRSIIYNLNKLALATKSLQDIQSTPGVTDWVDIKSYIHFEDIFICEILRARRSSGNLQIWIKGKPAHLEGSFTRNQVYAYPGQEGTLMGVLLGSLGFTSQGAQEQEIVYSQATHPRDSNKMGYFDYSTNIFDVDKIYVIFNLNSAGPGSQDEISFDFRTSKTFLNTYGETRFIETILDIPMKVME